MEEILKQLNLVAIRRMALLNVELSSTIQPYFDDLLRNAVDRMIRERRITDEDIDQATKNINLYIDELSKYKERQIGSNIGIIRFTALNESRMSICPLWPIC